VCAALTSPRANKGGGGGGGGAVTPGGSANLSELSSTLASYKKSLAALTSDIESKTNEIELLQQSIAAGANGAAAAAGTTTPAVAAAAAAAPPAAAAAGTSGKQTREAYLEQKCDDYERRCGELDGKVQSLNRLVEQWEAHVQEQARHRASKADRTRAMLAAGMHAPIHALAADIRGLKTEVNARTADMSAAFQSAVAAVVNKTAKFGTVPNPHDGGCRLSWYWSLL
jgi:hypothetical protein